MTYSWWNLPKKPGPGGPPCEGGVSAYALLHSQTVRLGQVSLKELAHDLDSALEEALPWALWFASG